MNQDRSSYKQIFKATSLFGGVQGFNIIISIIRSKFIAVLLGPAGMGIAELYNSTIGIIGAFTSFGLGTSAVKDVAAANATGNNGRISKVVTIFRRLVWITGLLGCIVVIALSPWLSKLTFGNSHYTLAFIWLSVTLLFNQLSRGQTVLLQGMRKLQYLAKANVIGAVAGLLISVPIYYFWHIDGIVPAIILTSIASLLISWFFAHKIPVNKTEVNFQQTITEGKDMLRMGIMLSLSGLTATLTSYALRIFISKFGGVEDVGLYSAGLSLILTYVGLVFTAMGTDYYPRLSAVAHNNAHATRLINEQAEITILILGPILAVFLIFSNWIVILLYSTKFIAVNEMIHYAALGIFFRAAMWVISFVFLAKGASKVYFWSELTLNIYMVVLNIAGYHYLGLTGLGISFLIGNVLSLLQVLLISKIMYKFSFTREFYKIFIPQLILGILCFFFITFFKKQWAYAAGIPIIGISVWFSFHELNERIGLLSVWQEIMSRLKKNS